MVGNLQQLTLICAIVPVIAATGARNAHSVARGREGKLWRLLAVRGLAIGGAIGYGRRRLVV